MKAERRTCGNWTISYVSDRLSSQLSPIPSVPGADSGVTGSSLPAGGVGMLAGAVAVRLGRPRITCDSHFCFPCLRLLV